MRESMDVGFAVSARGRVLLGWVRLGLVCFAMLLAGVPARADVTLLLQEPIDLLGHFSATGHATVLVSGLCSDDHLHMRRCRPGETGSVLGRYHHINGYDWLAMEPTAYLFAVDAPDKVPASVTEEDVDALRAGYVADHMNGFGSDMRQTLWPEMLGASYRRRIIAIRLRTTDEQDARLMQWLNESRNKSEFNFFFNNCADFSRKVLDVLFPGAVHRNLLFDAELTTPKQLASAMRGYARRHPEVGFEVAVLPQVPGTMPRSTKMYGVTESFVKRTWFCLPVAVLDPLEFGLVIGSGVFDPRWNVNRAAKTAPQMVLAGRTTGGAAVMTLEGGTVARVQ